MPLLGMGKWFFYWRWRVDSAPPGIGGGQRPSQEERRDDALPRDKWDDMLLFESKRGRRLSHGRKEDIAPPRDSRGMTCPLLRKEGEQRASRGRRGGMTRLTGMEEGWRVTLED